MQFCLTGSHCEAPPTARAAALPATAALLPTACSSGDDKFGDSDRNAGVGQGAKTREKAVSASGAPAEDKSDGVDLSVPGDMNLISDCDEPEGKNEAAALDDAANSTGKPYIEGKPDETTMSRYPVPSPLPLQRVQAPAWKARLAEPRSGSGGDDLRCDRPSQACLLPTCDQDTEPTR
jgi:hypothetical protein